MIKVHDTYIVCREYEYDSTNMLNFLTHVYSESRASWFEANPIVYKYAKGRVDKV